MRRGFGTPPHYGHLGGEVKVGLSIAYSGCKVCSCRLVVLVKDREAYRRAQDQPLDLAARGRERLCSFSRQTGRQVSLLGVGGALQRIPLVLAARLAARPRLAAQVPSRHPPLRRPLAAVPRLCPPPLLLPPLHRLRHQVRPTRAELATLPPVLQRPSPSLPHSSLAAAAPAAATVLASAPPWKPRRVGHMRRPHLPCACLHCLPQPQPASLAAPPPPAASAAVAVCATVAACTHVIPPWRRVEHLRRPHSSCACVQGARTHLLSLRLAGSAARRRGDAAARSLSWLPASPSRHRHSGQPLAGRGPGGAGGMLFVCCLNDETPDCVR